MSKRFDIPSPNAPNFDDRLRETAMVYLGSQGDRLDRGITVRDLVGAGVVKFAPGFTSAHITSDFVPLAVGQEVQAAYVPDLSPPPQPSGFTATGAISNIILEHSAPVFTQGHGYLRTNVYGAIYTGGALPTFADAVRITQFSGTVTSHAVNPSTTYRLWIKWQTQDGVESATPAGGTNGLAVTTAADVSLLLTALAGKVAASQLDATLTSRVNLIDGSSALTGSVAARILTETNTRVAALTQEASDRAAAIAVEVTARSNAITAEATARAAGLLTEANARAAAVLDEANARGAAITTETTARQSADTSLASQITTVTAANATNAAAITTETTARTSADTALASQITTVAAGNSTNAAAITTETTARQDADTSLASQITTVTSANNTNAAAIQTETTARSSADSSLAQSISLLTAGVAGGFDVGQAWYFDSTVESWTATGATLAWNAGWIDLTSTGSDPGLVSPTISIVGSQYNVVKLRIKRLAGSGWDGTVTYTTAGHGLSASYKKTISAPSPFAVGDTAVVDFDMGALTAGGTDWTSSTITGIRIDLGATSSDVISIDWVGIGRNAPGASQAALSNEQAARVAADAAEVTARTALAATVSSNTAAIATEQTARAAADTAISSTLTALTSTVSSNDSSQSAALASEASTRAGADTAEATARTTLAAKVDTKNTVYRQGTAPTAQAVGDLWIDTANNNISKRWDGSAWVASDDTRIASTAASLVTEQTTRASADIALSSSLTSLTSTVTSNNSTVTASIASEASTRASADTALSSSLSALTSTVNSNTAAITTEQVTRANADTALAASVTSLTSTVNTNDSTATAAISAEAATRASADTAISSTVTTLTSTVNGNTAAISTEAATRASADSSLFAQYTVKIDLAGLVSGYGLASSASNAAPSSSFAVRANSFYVAPPSVAQTTAPTVNLYDGYVWLDTSVTPNVTRYYNASTTTFTTTPVAPPFTVQATPTTINGVVVPPGVYMQNAYMSQLVATRGQIGLLAVDSARIADVSASKITAGTIAVGETISSANYVAGSAGWSINGGGNAEFSGVTVRGAVYASTGTIGGSYLSSTAITSTNWSGSGSPGATGWALSSDGNFYVNNIRARGQFNSGYFTGYAWPASGGGSHLSENGLLLGNPNVGTYFQVTAEGNLYAPYFNIVNGSAVFSGSLSAATGTFSGTLTASAVNAVNSINIAGYAVTVPLFAGFSGDTTFGGISAQTGSQYLNEGASIIAICTYSTQKANSFYGSSVTLYVSNSLQVWAIGYSGQAGQNNTSGAGTGYFTTPFAGYFYVYAVVNGESGGSTTGCSLTALGGKK